MPWARRITFGAPLVRGAIAALRANPNGLADAIAAFNLEGNVQLVAPNGVVDALNPFGPGYAFGAADPLILVNGPVVEVSIPRGQTGNWSVGKAEFDHDLRLNVCVWHEGDRGKLDTTYEMSLGLARCVIEVLAQDAVIGPEVELAEVDAVEWRADVIPEDPTDDGRDFRKWRVPVLIQFRLETVERFVP